jgi:hypothetical protein
MDKIHFGRAHQWFGFLTFSELLPCMRSYADWVRTGKKPSEEFARHTHLMQENNALYHQEHELFGYDDDE